MMNVVKARKIAEHVAKLAAISAGFASAYGPEYRITDASPIPAMDLYRQAMEEQTVIASLLNPTAREKAYSRYGQWWKRADVIPSSIVNGMASEVFALIGRTAYAEDKETGIVDPQHTLVLEQSIAGMLHPSTLRMHLAHSDEGDLQEAI